MRPSRTLRYHRDGAELLGGLLFEEVVINPNRETVTKDGTETTLEQALDLSHAEAEAVLESPNAAADYFSNSVYDSQTTEDGQVVIKAPFQTMRIILYADTLSDTYGAVEALQLPPIMMSTFCSMIPRKQLRPLTTNWRKNMARTTVLWIS